MINESILKQLRSLGKLHNWDIIEEIAELNGFPVYELRNSMISKYAKTGRPHLYSLTRIGMLYKLNENQVHEVIVSYNGLRKRIQ